MDVDDKAGLIQFLIGLKPSKKRDISEVSFTDERRQPLVKIRRRSFDTRRIEETPPAAKKPPLALVPMVAARRTRARAAAQPRGSTAPLGP